MAKRTGSADLSLHGGHVPPWLSARMAKLGRIVVEAVVLEYGHAQARALEGHAAGPSFDTFISDEKARAPEYGGRTVFDGK